MFRSTIYANRSLVVRHFKTMYTLHVRNNEVVHPFSNFMYVITRHLFSVEQPSMRDYSTWNLKIIPFVFKYMRSPRKQFLNAEKCYANVGKFIDTQNICVQTQVYFHHSSDIQSNVKPKPNATGWSTFSWAQA